MSNQRFLSWSAALLALKSDRAGLPKIREERLRSAAALHGAPALQLTAWRGRSGARYVCSIYDVEQPDLAADGLVVVAARRDESGVGYLISARSFEPADPRRQSWIAACRRDGATELHVHRLAANEADRQRAAADLQPPSPS